MKKLIALLLALALVCSLAACGSKDDTPSPDSNNSANTEIEETTPEDTDAEKEDGSPVDAMELKDVMEDILDGVADLPMYEITELTEENFEFMTFVPYADGYEGVTADALIGSIAHSVVLVRVPDGTDAAQVAADMEANANPNKWVCVGAEATHVRQHGNTILLVMSSVDIANAILVNFDSLAGEATPESDLAAPVSGEGEGLESLDDPTATPDDDTAEEPVASKPDNTSSTNTNTGSNNGSM